MKYASLWERLMVNTSEPENEQSCWRWSARLDREGYGLINLYVPGLLKTRTMKAHILLWLWLESGARTPDDLFLAYLEHSASGLELDHVCCERWCVRPCHLDLVTGSENSRRRDQRRLRVSPNPQPLLQLLQSTNRNPLEIPK